MSLDPNLPNYQHPNYNEFSPYLEFSQAAYEGLSAWILNGKVTDDRLAQKMLPPEEKEPKERYRMRLIRSRWQDFYKRTIEGFSGILSQFTVNPETLNWLSVEEREKQLNNVDLQGSSLQSFLIQADREAMLKGFCAILVEFPRRPTDIIDNAAIEQEIGLRPYLSLIKREDIINWFVDYDISGALVLKKLIIRRNLARPKGNYGIEFYTQYWELMPGNYLVWEVEGEKSILVEEIPISLPYIPIVFYPTNQINPFDLKPPLYDLALDNLAHYQIYSDYREMLHFLSLPVFVRKGYATNEGRKDVIPPLILSPAFVADVPLEGDIKIIETSGEGISLNREALADLETGILRRSLEFFSGITSNMTATEANFRSTQTKANLQLLSSQKQSSVQEIFDLWASWLNIEQQGQGIIIDKSIFKPPLTPQAIQAFSQLVIQGQLDFETFLEILKQGQGLPEGIEINEILERTGYGRQADFTEIEAQGATAELSSINGI